MYVDHFSVSILQHLISFAHRMEQTFVWINNTQAGASS